MNAETAGAMETRQMSSRETLEKFLEQNKISLPPILKERLLLLDKPQISEGEEISPEERPNNFSHTLDVARTCAVIASMWEKTNELRQYVIKKRELILAALLHDIGKTGPSGTDPKTQEIWVKSFSIFNKSKEGDKQSKFPETPAEEALAVHLKITLEDAQRLILAMEEGLGKKIETMRDIYNSHVQNTADTLLEAGVNPEIIFIASRHHEITNHHSYTPLGPGELPNFESTPQNIEALERAARILEIADQFQASVTRNGNSDPQKILKRLETFEPFKEFLDGKE